MSKDKFVLEPIKRQHTENKKGEVIEVREENEK